MTDREKLEKLNEIGCNICIYKFKHECSDKMSRFINALYDKYFPWQPSGRACFDKPAGTPILHGETVE